MKRIKERRRKGDPVTLEAFKEIDGKENLGYESGQEIQKCLENADFLILNNSTTKELEEKIDNILDEIGKKS